MKKTIYITLLLFTGILTAQTSGVGGAIYSGVASHPGDLGMKAIANKIIYNLSLSTEETTIE